MAAVICDRADAHWFVEYVSTPVSPPQGLEWVFPAAMAALAIGATLLVRALLLRSWKWSILSGLAAVAMLGGAFRFSEVFAGAFSTGPPPMLGPPCPAFEGWGWDRVGGDFVTWNLAGVAFMLSGLLLAVQLARSRGRVVRLMLLGVAAGWVFVAWGACRDSETALPVALALGIGCVVLMSVAWRAIIRTVIVVLGVVVIYVGLLTPFIVRHAWSHGWGGVYVWHACQDQMAAIGYATIDYAAEHDGRLPEAATTEELLAKVSPYLAGKTRARDNPIQCCPLLSAYGRYPQAFKWDASFSGRKLAALPEDQSDPLLSCPCHRMNALSVNDLLNPDESYLMRRARLERMPATRQQRD